ncbi:TPA: molybdenum ABC transporter ATP-binding protein ModC [Vibrio vulnificus]
MKGLQVAFKQTLGHVVFDIELQLPSKGVSAIFGRSGAGKTSIINVISGLTQPEQGRIALNSDVLFDSVLGINVPVHQRNIGYVFQDSRLFPHYHVEGNLKYGVKQYDAEMFDKVVMLLALQPLLKRYPASLSGGEKQRVAIGRALLSSPKILLMDEPLASLDMPRKKEVLPFLEKLSESFEIPIVYVTHSLQEILRLADHLTVLDRGQIVASGLLSEVWSSQAMRPWQSFSEQSTLFNASIAEQHPQYALTRVMLSSSASLWVQKIDAPLGSDIRLQVRANDVSITLAQPQKTSIRNIIEAKVERVEKRHPAEDKESIAVKLALTQDCFLWATITPWALVDLNLKQGDRVFAQIKGVSVTQRDIALTH